MTTHTHYSLGTHIAGKKSVLNETARCGLDSALNLAQFGCLILYGSSNWESNLLSDRSVAYECLRPPWIRLVFAHVLGERIWELLGRQSNLTAVSCARYSK